MDALFGPLAALPLLMLLPLMAGVDTDWIEVFRAGDYPQGGFSADEVAGIAERYDADVLEAPVTTDHKQEGPAYGWIDAAKAEAGRLWVKLKRVPKAFAEAVNERRFHSRSVEIFTDFDGGGPYLKALTFLGARAPQVKGLDPVGKIEFSDEHLAKETITFNFEGADDTEDLPAGSAAAMPESEQADPSQPDTEDDDEAEQERPGTPARRNSDPDDSDASKQEASEEDASEEDASEEEDEGREKGEPEGEQFSDRSSFAAMRQELAAAQSENQRLRSRAERREREQAAEDFEQFCSEQMPPRVRDRAQAVFFALKGAEDSGAITFAHDDHDSALACFKELLDELSFGHLFGTFAEESPGTAAAGKGDDLGDAVRETMVEQGTL